MNRIELLARWGYIPLAFFCNGDCTAKYFFIEKIKDETEKRKQKIKDSAKGL
jgi:hypothetical protein